MPMIRKITIRSVTGSNCLKIKEKYYMLTSFCTGWAPNQGKYAVADSIEGRWSMLTEIGMLMKAFPAPEALRKRRFNQHFLRSLFPPHICLFPKCLKGVSAVMILEEYDASKNAVINPEMLVKEHSDNCSLHPGLPW